MARFVFDAKLSTAIEEQAAAAAADAAQTKADSSPTSATSPRSSAAAGERGAAGFGMTRSVDHGSAAAAPQAAARGPLSQETVAKMQKYWQAANYLTVGHIYLQENPLLRHRLSATHIKPRLLGHWGTSSGQNFVYVHLNLLGVQQIQLG